MGEQQNNDNQIIITGRLVSSNNLSVISNELEKGKDIKGTDDGIQVLAEKESAGRGKSGGGKRWQGK